MNNPPLPSLILPALELSAGKAGRESLILGLPEIRRNLGIEINLHKNFYFLDKYVRIIFQYEGFFTKDYKNFSNKGVRNLAWQDDPLFINDLKRELEKKSFNDYMTEQSEDEGEDEDIEEKEEMPFSLKSNGIGAVIFVQITRAGFKDLSELNGKTPAELARKGICVKDGDGLLKIHQELRNRGYYGIVFPIRGVTVGIGAEAPDLSGKWGKIKALNLRQEDEMVDKEKEEKLYEGKWEEISEITRQNLSDSELKIASLESLSEWISKDPNAVRKVIHVGRAIPTLNKVLKAAGLPPIPKGEKVKKVKKTVQEEGNKIDNSNKILVHEDSISKKVSLDLPMEILKHCL